MMIASIKSNKFKGLNGLNDVPFIGSWVIAIGSMLPMFGFHELIQAIFGRNEIFDLSFTFFLNNLCFHVFLMFVLDIKIKLFFVSSIVFCLFCTILNGYREYDAICLILSS